MRLLTKDEIELRVKKFNNKDKENATKAMLVLYKTARTDMNILDETFGFENWQSDYKDLKDVMYCGIGIRASKLNKDLPSDEYVWKWNAGSESNTEKEKGEASDAFKRAGVLWGIGRELYKWHGIWVPYIHKQDQYRGFKIDEIAYDENGEPSKLKVLNCKNEVVYQFGELRKESERVTKIRKMLRGQERFTLESVQKAVANSYNGKALDGLTGQEFETVYNQTASACMEEAAKQ